MWNEMSIRKLWYEVITDLRLEHPVWLSMMKDQGYRAIVVDKKANYFGQCDYRKKTVSINLHLHRNSSKENIVDTMKHEIAHAIDHCVHGRSSGHGDRWKKISIALGSIPKATSKNAVKVEYKYVECVHTEDRLYFVKGYNRKPAYVSVGAYQIGAYLRSDKEGTMNALIVYPWSKWVFLCRQHGVGIYREDHRN